MRSPSTPSSTCSKAASTPLTCLPTSYPPAHADPKTPLDFAGSAQCRRHRQGRRCGSKYAPDSLQKAEDYLARAEDYLQRKQGNTPIGTAARGATQMAEDARVLTLRRKEAGTDRNTKNRPCRTSQRKAEADAQAAAEAEAQARAQAEEDARTRAQAEADQSRGPGATGASRCRCSRRAGRAAASAGGS